MLFQQHLTTLSKTAHINDDPIIHSLLPDSLIHNPLLYIHNHFPHSTFPPQYPNNMPYQPLPQYHNNPNLNVQYIYLPTNSDNSNSNISTTTHIQELRSQADWAAWYQSIKNVLTARGLLNHIYKPPAPNIPWTVLNVLSYPPVLQQGYTPAQIQEWQNWCRKDMITFSVITSRLAREILGMIPSIQDPSTGNRQTTHKALQLLYQQFYNMHFLLINDSCLHIATPYLTFQTSFKLGLLLLKLCAIPPATLSPMLYSASMS